MIQTEYVFKSGVIVTRTDKNSLYVSEIIVMRNGYGSLPMSPVQFLSFFDSASQVRDLIHHNNNVLESQGEFNLSPRTNEL